MRTGSLRTIDSWNEVVRAHVCELTTSSESRMLHLTTSSSFFSLFRSILLSLTNALSWMHIYHLIGRRIFFKSAFARQPWFLPGWACTARPRWTDIYHDCSRHLFSHLVSPSCVTVHNELGLLIFSWLSVNISTSSDTSTIDYLMMLSTITWVLVSEFKTAAIVVLTSLVPVHFSTVRRPVVGHRDVALTVHMCSNR